MIGEHETVVDYEEAVAKAVGVLGESFGRKITKVTIDAYVIGLEGMSVAMVQQATARALRSCKFFPSAFELRQLAGESSVSERALVAWTVVFGAMGSTGGYLSVDFDDPVINATIRSMGGWPKLNDTQQAEMPFRQKDFERIYASLANVGITSDMARPLPGLIEVDNGSKGLPSPNQVRRIETGLPQHSKSVFRIGEGASGKPVKNSSVSIVADLAKRLELKDR